MKKLLGISLVAIMSVTAANAEIASKAYVDTTREAVTNKSTKTSDFVEADYNTTNYPSMATAKAIAEAVSGGANYVEKNQAITAGTATKITYDAKGLVTGGANLAASDIPDLSLSKITDVTASAADLNQLAGKTLGTAAEAATASSVAENGTGLPTAGAVYTAIADAQSDLNDAIDAKLDANTAITAGTATKITYDAKGLVTGGANLAASDIPDLSLSKITDVTASAADLNQLTGKTLGAAAEKGVAASITEDGTDLATAGQVYAAQQAATSAVTNLDQTAAEVKGQQTGNVVVGVAQTDGAVSATFGNAVDAVSTASGQTGNVVSAVALNADGHTIDVTKAIKAVEETNTIGAAGHYVLTADVDNNGVTNYQWELIQRAE